MPHSITMQHGWCRPICAGQGANKAPDEQGFNVSVCGVLKLNPAVAHLQWLLLQHLELAIR